MTEQDIWVTQDRRRLVIKDIDDAHLSNIVNMGLRALAKKFRDEGLACLAGAAGGDDGCQYFADVQCNQYMEMAGNRRELLQRLARTKRYGGVVREARSRALQRRARTSCGSTTH